MPIPSIPNPISLSDIQNEIGGTNPISLSEYYGMVSGVPSTGPISIGNFSGKTYYVVETITSNTVWTPKLNLARYIHIFVVGAGGSGGHGWPARNVGFFGNTDGVAGGAGGGGGGTAYSKIAASSAAASAIVIGVGGTGVHCTSEDSSVDGNSGTSTTFVGSGLNMTGAGGLGGQASKATSGHGDSTSGSGGAGGVATGGNTGNFSGGAGGGYSVSGSNPQHSGAGGGAPRFSSSDPVSAADSSTETVTQGMKVSEYSSWPSILTSYIIQRSQTPVLSSTNTNFNASSGTITAGGTASPVYAAGSGGSGAESSDYTGNGGNGIVFIVYEI